VYCIFYSFDSWRNMVYAYLCVLFFFLDNSDSIYNIHSFALGILCFQDKYSIILATSYLWDLHSALLGWFIILSISSSSQENVKSQRTVKYTSIWFCSSFHLSLEDLFGQFCDKIAGNWLNFCLQQHCMMPMQWQTNEIRQLFQVIIL
jgi:hypothetical protein